MSKFFLDQDNTTADLSKVTICDKSFTEYVIFEICIVTCVYIYLGFTILLNRCKVSHVALVNKIPFSPSIKIKFAAHLIMILLLGGSLALSFSDSSFWLKGCDDSLFGLLYIFHMIVLMFNIDWLKYQFERKIPLHWYQNSLFWGLTSTSYLLAFVACYVINPSRRFDNPDFYLVICKLLVSVSVTVYTLRKPQDVPAYLLDNTLRVRLMENQDHLVLDAECSSPSSVKSNSPTNKSKRLKSNRSTADTSIAPALVVTVANRIQTRINPDTKIMEIVYKIHVRWGTLDHKIHKTLNDFRQLEINITKENTAKGTKSGALDSLYSVFSDPEAESMANVSFVVLTLQNFFTTIVCAEKITNSLLEFLEIPESQHISLVNWSRRSFYFKDIATDLEDGNNMPGIAFKLEDSDSEKDRRSSSGSQPELMFRRETLQVNRATEEDYFPFFNVSIPKYKRAVQKDYIEFMINLSLMEKPEETWQIGKRYSDFVELRQSLKSSLNILPPKLPKKLIMVTEDSQLEERRKGLESWLRVVLNEKLYFIPQLFHFIGLNPSYYEWLQDEDTHTHHFGNMRADIADNQILIKDNKPYTVYHIEIEDTHDMRNCYTIYRRFKEFYQLHHALQRRFFKSVIKLPDLPPKYTAFSNKTTVEFRQQALERYLNQLFTYPDIGDSFAFRKFIHYKRPIEYFASDKESPVMIINQSYEVDSPNISNVAIERSLSTARSNKKPY